MRHNRGPAPPTARPQPAARFQKCPAAGRCPPRPGRTAAMRRTRSPTLPVSPGPPPPVVPQVPRKRQITAGHSRRAPRPPRERALLPAPPRPDRAPEPRRHRAPENRAGTRRAGSPAPRRSGAGAGSANPGHSAFPFVFFRFLSFLPPVTGGQRLRGAATPPCRRVTHRASRALPAKPLRTASPPRARSCAFSPPSTPERRGGGCRSPAAGPRGPRQLERHRARRGGGTGHAKCRAGGPGWEIPL